MKPPFVSQFVFSLPKKVKKTQKEEGAEKKDKTGDTINSSFTNVPATQVTGSHWASAGPCPAAAPPSHHGLMLSARVRWQHSSVDLPGKWIPHLQLTLLLPLLGCFMACSLPAFELCTVQELATKKSGFKWTCSTGVGILSKDPLGRNALRKGTPASSLSSDTQTRLLAFTFR